MGGCHTRPRRWSGSISLTTTSVRGPAPIEKPNIARDKQLIASGLLFHRVKLHPSAAQEGGRVRSESVCEYTMPVWTHRETRLTCPKMRGSR
jgi:hypothetical protein